MDDSTTLGALRAAIEEFVRERDWQRFHTPKNLAMSIAIEAAELMEHFQWYGVEESAARLTDPVIHAEVSEELADVLIYCLSLANAAQIDVSAAVQKKMARNQRRFPADKVVGKLG
jgi:NTP pyrophosphatase (non-canonical NTP hydrolase)